MTRPDPTNHQAANRAALSVKGAGMSAYDIPGNHENVPERGWDQEADHVALEAVAKLANELTAPADPNYKDDWERGYDAGREEAGRELIQVLRKQGFIQ